MNSSLRRRGLYLVLSLVLFLSGAVALVPSAQAAQQPAAAQPPKQIWFRMRVSANTVAWFNQVARPIDLASVTSRDLGLLSQITTGRKEVLFASAAEAEQIVPSIAGQFTDLGYDLEHWPQTPANEQADPVAAVRRMRALADKYGLTFTLGPDRRFTEQFGAQMAPYADAYILQVQRLQGSPSALLSAADPLIQALHAANPKLKILVQIGSSGTADDLMSLVRTLAPSIDGISLLANTNSLAVASQFVQLLDQGVVVSATAIAAATQTATAVAPLSTAVLATGAAAISVTPSITATAAITGTPITVALTPTAAITTPAPLALTPTGTLPAVTATATPAALPATGRRPSPIGLILVAGVIGIALGAGGLAAYIYFRNKTHAE